MRYLFCCHKETRECGRLLALCRFQPGLVLNLQADIWSCGVVLYMTLTGLPPFLGDTLHDVFDNILKGGIDYESPPWPELTEEAKVCTKKMLTYQSKKRPSAAMLLADPWCKVDGAAPDKPMNSAVIKRFQGFSGK